MRCEGCDRESWHSVCWDCVKARHRAVVMRRCACRKADRRERFVMSGFGRSWISCDRCLGQVRQVS